MSTKARYLQSYSGGDLYFKILDYASNIGSILAVGLYFCEVMNDDLCAYDNIDELEMEVKL